jgi:hypothetical protein
MALEDVPAVRRFVEKLHRRLVTSSDDVARVAMATHELLENAVKFSTDGNATLKIEVVDGEQIRITTRNAARTADREGLRVLTEQLAAAPDPMVFYLQRMQEAPAERGGLGIGRVAAEGEMTIGVTVDGDVVEVRAQSPLHIH